MTGRELAAQLVAAHRAAIAAGVAPTAGLGAWSMLRALAEAAPAAERPALAPLIEEAATRDGRLDVRALVAATRLHPPDAAAARINAARAATAPDAWDELGVLLAAPPIDDEALVAALDRAARLPDDAARWAACDDLVGELDDADERRWRRWFADACVARHGRASDDPYRWLDEPDAAQRARRAADERARWGATFEAWRLGDAALALDEPARGAMLDRAIDAFAELVATPIDPGNDEGPFWAIARHLSRPQVERALGILARMDASAWCYELAGSRAALATRLAWLGDAVAARAVIAAIGTTGAFDRHWRATAWGGVVAGRLVAEPALELAVALAEAAAVDPATFEDVAGRFRVLSELHYQLATHTLPARADAVGAACLGEVQAIAARDPRLGRIALEEAIGAWGAVVPAARWLALIDGHPPADRYDLWEALLDVEPITASTRATVLAGIVGELARTPPPYPALLLRRLWAAHPDVPSDGLARAWDAWLASAGAPDFARSSGELVAVIGPIAVALAGHDAPAAACRALAAVR